jgi:ribulose-phosphate 3-epimerase
VIEVIPSLLVESEREFEQKLRLIENDCKTVHVDILDGTLFPSTNWFDAKAVGAMRTPVKFELHLMVENPIPIVAEWKKHVKGTSRAIVHAEMKRSLGAVLDHLESIEKLETGVAVNPETPLSAIHEVMHRISQLTVMGVHPGSSGQAFLGRMILEKIRQAREHRKDLAIEIDGGVTGELLAGLVQAGATRVCAASMLFSAGDPAKALRDAKSAVSTGRKRA